ncbi:MAG TPA: hypothetical protein VGO07_05715 [Candidatus Saccharimonadales bacterium]|jgi:hypothetical protein|nr:hypothetical protein [Candidatus Saccharimonadales bacterium]
MNIPTENRQRGNTIVVILAAICIFAVVATGLIVVMHSKKDKPVVQGSGSQQKDTSTVSDNSTNANGSELEALRRASRNTQRANDASNLGAAVEEFINNNGGQLPSSYANGQLTGGEGSIPAAVSFKGYTDVQVAAGGHAAVTADQVTVVTGAECGTDGQALAASSSRSIVVLWGYENDAAGFTGKCAAG